MPLSCSPTSSRRFQTSAPQWGYKKCKQSSTAEKGFFWVCRLLGILFKSEFAGKLVFKGGTSLSKVFGVIDRFSEDIDLSLSPQFLNLPEAGTSRTQANQWMAKAESACSQAVRDLIAPVLEAAAHEAVGDRGNAWFEFLNDPATHSPVLLFHYPPTQPDGFPYLKRSVKLEFGSLTDQQPTGHHQVAPWIADVLPEAFPDWRCEVVALEVQRTFWEKATILHTEFHRPADKPTPGRFARHYADMATLATHPDAGKAAADDELRSRVVHWKSRFFGSSWARYDEAVPGSFVSVRPTPFLPASLVWWPVYSSPQTFSDPGHGRVRAMVSTSSCGSAAVREDGAGVLSGGGCSRVVVLSLAEAVFELNASTKA
jgi:hypothetical protein